MSEARKDIELEIAHVLFIDIVGYSKQSVDEQRAQIEELNEIVRLSEQFRKAEDANRLLKIPTGDGFALVFYKSPEEPAQCAVEVARALRNNPRLHVRMGVHSGPVSGVIDLNGHANVAGTGINIAQRVMSCGDGGHILVSRHVAEDLAEYGRWRSVLHDIGTFEVKHGARVALASLYSDDFGNPRRPAKLEAIRQRRARARWAATATAMAALVVIGWGVFWFVRRPPSSPPRVPDNSIAVLPFVNMSEDKANDYFSDGVSEELLNLLAKIPQLKVTARVSSFSFKDKELDIPEIARRLGVAHVLEGSVRKAGDQVRITAQLIHASDGFHIWSETYDRKLDDIFKIQDEVAAKVVNELKVTLLEEQPKSRTTDPKAYALFLQAKQLARQRTAEAFEQSDALYRQVLEIDPRYAPAWERLASNSISKATFSMVPNPRGFAPAREMAEKALAIDPNYAPAHATLGYIASLENDAAGAAKHFERALTLDSTDIIVLGNASSLLLSLGRLDQALAVDEAIVRRDPLNTTSLINLAYHQRLSGEYDEAIASYRTALSLNPGRGHTHAQIGETLLLKGNAAEALAEIEQETIDFVRMETLPMAYHALGRKADSDSALAALIAKYEKDACYNIAYVYAFRGEADAAFAWLDKAVEHHDGGLSEIVTDDLFDKIHSDPRWLPFLRKIGKAPDQLAKIKFNVTLPPKKD